ncbi:EAL domain-containing protein [Nocardioides sp. BP30]|uniref:putative bifunctional diguanylate cyclase/phosphodiesterase n=1 Tax=Nocardioides sp. BP30 TaxID=3036374 RepID=UPI002468B047|nr:EAL domain-containing protein [Nocardioides sp. BP30]WGL52248.1 EAL domain-containing protein [Nocardioides sp. BP30]
MELTPPSRQPAGSLDPAGSSASGGRQPRVLSSRGLAIVCIAVAVLAVLVIAFAGAHPGGDAFSHPVALAVLTVLLTYTHVRPTRLVHRHGGVESDHLDEALFVPMVLMLSPVEVGAAVTVASLVGNLVVRRAAVKVLFNVGQTVLACLTGYAVARAGGAGPDESITPMAMVAGAVGGLVFAALSSVAVATIVRLATGHPLFRGLWEQWRSRELSSFGALLFGVVAGVAVREHAWMALPAIALGLTVERAYVAVVVQRQARLAAEALREAVVAVRSSDDPEEVREQVLASAKTVLHAREAVLVDPTTPCPPGALQANLEDTTLQVLDRIGGGTWLDSERSALSTLATVGSAALRNARLIAHMSAITDSQSEGVLAIDAAGVVTFANPASQRLVGCEDLIGRVADQVFGLTGHDGPVDLTALAGSHSGTRDSDAVLLAGDHRTPVSFTATGLPEPQTGVVLVIHDITERKAFEEKLTYLAFHDPLTYLPNRRLFEDRLDHALLLAERHHTTSALLMVDLDRFKLVNDSYGHPAGDSLLVQVAHMLRRSLRREDTCARLGGDEFAILLEDVADVHHATSIAQRILDALASGCIVDGHELFVSASIGIATSDQAGSREELVAAADAAAYMAKAAGKAQYRVFAPEGAENPRARLELEGALRRAIDHEELVLHYQPLVDTITGEAVGAEALVRWQTPDGLMAPYSFIPLAEETGLIVPLGAWVLEEACRQAQEWTLAHPELPPLEISVNLSAHQLSRPNIVGEIGEVLERTGLRPEQLCLEITETVIMRDAEAAISSLRQLKRIGLQLAIDDFGTGYSSLSYLKQFPVDVVKVDRTFLAGLGDNAVDTEIVAAVIRLAAACGITAVAEGVETVEQRALLEEMGCPLIQGFLISKPMPAEDFATYWATEAPLLLPSPRP